MGGLYGFCTVQNSTAMVVNCCRAAASPNYFQTSSTSSRPSTVCVRQLSCGELDCSTSRRGLLSLLGAFSLTATAPLENVAVASPSCDFTVAPSGLGFCDTSPGTGLPPSQGMLIKANYIGKLEDGKVFDSSYNRGKPLTFKIGVGQVIKGWDEGILGGEGVPPMLAGGKRRLRIPPQLGYGDRGAGCRAGSCLIPPNSVLLFDVEFVGKAY
ncbi:hypothetical protein L7F22_038501 [Adiantum nelumboides]|nr:hypothetical protein [Adiantum nelumboides]